jgi:hypothetical protein
VSLFETSLRSFSSFVPLDVVRKLIKTGFPAVPAMTTNLLAGFSQATTLVGRARLSRWTWIIGPQVVGIVTIEQILPQDKTALTEIE